MVWNLLISYAHPAVYINSSLDYLLYLIQCKCCVNSCWQEENSSFAFPNFLELCFLTFFYLSQVKSTVMEAMGPRADCTHTNTLYKLHYNCWKSASKLLLLQLCFSIKKILISSKLSEFSSDMWEVNNCYWLSCLAYVGIWLGLGGWLQVSELHQEVTSVTAAFLFEGSLLE